MVDDLQEFKLVHQVVDAFAGVDHLRLQCLATSLGRNQRDTLYCTERMSAKARKSDITSQAY